MANVMSATEVKDTQLYRKLHDGFPLAQREAERFAVLVAELCEEASDRIKAMPALHREFTLHDSIHLARVAEMMARILGTGLEELNPVEVGLLLLSAYWHDQGMVPDEAEWPSIEASPEYELQRERWVAEHPNFREIADRLKAPTLRDGERDRLGRRIGEMEDAIVSEYLRRTHGDRVATMVRARFTNDARLSYAGVNLSDQLARLCRSHCLPPDSLASGTDYRLDELIGTQSVNMRYLAVILRLADILDFDRDRTPDSLYKTIHFTNDVSIAEWEKHRGVQGWEVSPGAIRFEMRFANPAYERTARAFLDDIDRELAAAHDLVRAFPAGSRPRTLSLAHRVDRSAVGPKSSTYVYHDLEFSLSRDEIVKLLMTDRLYGDKWLAVRELLQNSLDALRYRRALLASAGAVWTEGRVHFLHGTDVDGCETVACSDNGAGMDEAIIVSFLTKVGRSFYRSPEFEQERVRFRAAGCDFDPCSQFGIGFMSCFLLGDRIRIETRRDYGPQRGLGRPWTVEINGLSSILVLRPGSTDQPVGTTVTITGRRKPDFLDEWVDEVRLCEVLGGYALAAEFPVEGRCAVAEIAEEVTVQPGVATHRTLFEELGIQTAVTLEQPFAELDPRLQGAMRESFLLDDDGTLTLANRDASWEPRSNPPRAELRLASAPEKGHSRETYNHNQLCVDGVLVCGRPGLRRRLGHLGGWANPLAVSPAYLLDVRGALKPLLTPARTPPQRVTGPFGPRDPTWRRLAAIVRRAEGRLVERLLSFSPARLPLHLIWELLGAHGLSPTNLTRSGVWDRMVVPVLGGGSVSWIPVRELGGLRLMGEKKEPLLVTRDGRRVGPTEAVKRWHSPDWNGGEIISLVLSCSECVGFDGEGVLLEVRRPTNPDAMPSELGFWEVGAGVWIVPFTGDLGDHLAIVGPRTLANANHPLVQLAADPDGDAPGDLGSAARSLLFWLDSAKDLREPQEARGRWPATLASRWHYSDWSDHQDAMPPYKAIAVGHGQVVITQAVFDVWGAATLLTEADDEVE